MPSPLQLITATVARLVFDYFLADQVGLINSGVKLRNMHPLGAGTTFSAVHDELCRPFTESISPLLYCRSLNCIPKLVRAPCRRQHGSVQQCASHSLAHRSFQQQQSSICSSSRKCTCTVKALTQGGTCSPSSIMHALLLPFDKAACLALWVTVHM